jgi:hypothetical protein
VKTFWVKDLERESAVSNNAQTWQADPTQRRFKQRQVLDRFSLQAHIEEPFWHFSIDHLRDAAC